MARILSLLILLVIVSVLAADPVQPCYDKAEYSSNFANYRSKTKEQTKIFQDAPGATETKYKAFKPTWTKIASLTKTFIEENFAENNSSGCMEKEILSRYFEYIMRFLKARIDISEKEYLTSTDPRILKKIEDKYTEIDACFENSRNLTAGNPIEESKINFCTYNMVEALDCTKKIFENDQDEPLLGLNAFTNFFVTAYDCKEEDRGVIWDIVLLLIFEGLTHTSEFSGRQSFFHGYQQTVKYFTE